MSSKDRYNKDATSNKFKYGRKKKSYDMQSVSRKVGFEYYLYVSDLQLKNCTIFLGNNRSKKYRDSFFNDLLHWLSLLGTNFNNM